jgi:outer membrane protein TolC
MALLGAGLAVPARAVGERTVSTAVAGEPEPAELRLKDGQLALTLDEAIELALERNLGLRVQRYGLAQARLGIQQAAGIYDLGLGGSLSSSHDESPASSQLEGAEVQEQDRDSFSLGLAQLVPTGGTLSIGTGATKLETNSLFFTLNPSYSAGLDLSYSQPLLRNFGKETTEFGIAVARLASDQSRELFTEQLIATVQAVENAYWRLVEANEQLKVAEESKRLAMQLHQNNRVRVEVGTLAPLELVASEAGIATREEEVILARADVGNAEDVLKTLLRLEGEAAWAAAVVPETAPEIAPPAVDLGKALATALAARPELAREKLAQRSRVVEAAYYRGQTRPRLDLRVNYGYNGIGGDAIVRDDQGDPIDTLEGGLGDAYDQILDADFPGWSVGLEFGYPLQNRTAKARAAIAGLEAERGEVAIAQLEQRINTEVRLAVRALDTARQELASAKVSVRLQTANLDAERKKFLNGLSTSFQILEVEEDLTAARSREARAVTGYRRALVGYYQAIGKLLEESRVAIAD